MFLSRQDMHPKPNRITATTIFDTAKTQHNSDTVHKHAFKSQTKTTHHLIAQLQQKRTHVNRMIGVIPARVMRAIWPPSFNSKSARASFCCITGLSPLNALTIWERLASLALA